MEPSCRLFQPFCGLFHVQLCLGVIIAILKNNRGKEKDLVATGILPVILGRLASRPYSLSHHSASAPIRIGYGHKTFGNYYTTNKTKGPRETEKN